MFQSLPFREVVYVSLPRGVILPWRGQRFQLRLTAAQDLTLFGLSIFYPHTFALYKYSYYRYLFVGINTPSLSLLHVSLFATTGFSELHRALFRLANNNTMIL